MERRSFLTFAIAAAGVAAITTFASASSALPRLAPSPSLGDAPVPQAAVATPDDMERAKIEKAQANWHWYGHRGNARFSRSRRYWSRYK